MEFLQQALDFLLHLDVHLLDLSQQYGTWLYAILFLVVFSETGLVVAPFLPGDSLLFAVGSLCALGALDVVTVMLLLMSAALLGDNVNYWIGRRVGPAIFRRERSRFFRKEYLERTHAFYEKHGGKTIIIARFIPIIRTFAPFVAGIGSMRYRTFIGYCVVGAVAWVSAFTMAGFLFGNLPIVRNNFTLVILVIILISLLPGVFEYMRHKRSTRPPAATS